MTLYGWLLFNQNIHMFGSVGVRCEFQSTQQNPALLTSARLPLFHKPNWGSANGIMWVGSPHKWSPWWGAGSPSYPLTLFKASPFTVSQTAALRQHRLCCHCSGAELRVPADVTGIEYPFVPKNEIYIRHFLKIISKAVWFYYIVHCRWR